MDFRLSDPGHQLPNKKKLNEGFHFICDRRQNGKVMDFALNETRRKEFNGLPVLFPSYCTILKRTQA
jgi:hypothetical protein